MRDKIRDFGVYPFSLPAVRQLDSLKLDPGVTCFIGGNGAAKSALIEAIAVAAGINA